MSFIVHKPVDIVDKREISTYKRIAGVEKPVDNTPVKGQDKRPKAALDWRVAAAVSHERGLLI